MTCTDPNQTHPGQCRPVCRPMPLPQLATLLLLYYTTATLAVPAVRPHPLYEPADPQAQPDPAWQQQPPGLAGAVGSIDLRYPRHRFPAIAAKKSWSGVAWRGQRLSAQCILWSPTPVNQLRMRITALTSPDGVKLPPATIRPHFVRYVLSDDGRQGCGKLDPETPATLLPDILDTAETIDMPAASVRPLWLLIDIPADAPPANYRAQLIVTADDAPDITFDLNIEVLHALLPPPADWAFYLDLWQNPWSLARYHQVVPWSTEHWALLEPVLTLLGQAGQKCISTTLIDQPWGGQTYDPYGSMVQWIRHPDGTWTYDYTLFDQYVEFSRRCGIGPQINCYSMVPWTNRFQYHDQATGNVNVLEAAPGDDAYENHWRPFLADFSKHLAKKGWLDRTSIALDERADEEVINLIAFLNQTAPNLKIAFAGHYNQKTNPSFYDFCIFVGHIDGHTPQAIKERTAANLITTFYVCCSNPAPNNFTFSPPAESAWMGWFAAAKGYSGNLRWAYNSWTADPLWDTRHVTFQAGDCFLVYPGPRSSIRFERLREGIQDYEKIRILRQAFSHAHSDRAASALKKLDDLLTQISYPQSHTAATIAKGQKLLNQLTRQLNQN